MKRDAYLHVFKHYWTHPLVVFSAVLSAVGTILIRIVTVFYLSRLSVALVAGNTSEAKTNLFIYAAVGTSALIINISADLLGLKYENEVYGRLSKTLYRKLTSKDMSFYNNSHTGYLTTAFRHNNDSGINLNKILRKDVPRTIVSLVAPIVVIAWYAPWIAVVCIIMAVLQIIYIIKVSQRVDVVRQRSHELYRRLSGRIADDITNIVSLKSSGQEDKFIKEVDKMVDEETETYWQRRFITTIYNVPREIIVQILVVIIFYLAINSGGNTEDTVFLLVLLIAYVFQIMRNIRQIPDLMSSIDDHVTKLESTLSLIFDDDIKIKDGESSTQLEVSKGEVEFSNITFGYKDDERHSTILNGFSVSIPGGVKLGIVGISGAGKSTLANLTMRFNDVDKGSIKIDGQNIKDVTQSSLRKSIAYVTQEPLLFHRSVKDNIMYGNSKKTQKEVEKAAKAAHAHEFIKELPKGYDTIVGERGVKLSGGQKQRVVIARAVLKNAPIVLFDEATSALDSESEEIIQQALPEIIGDHTAIIIAHRLSTVAGLDRIIVIDKGQIIEDGTHKQLLAKKGKYHSLWQKQTREG